MLTEGRPRYWYLLVLAVVLDRALELAEEALDLARHDAAAQPAVGREHERRAARLRGKGPH